MYHASSTNGTKEAIPHAVTSFASLRRSCRKRGRRSAGIRRRSAALQRRRLRGGPEGGQADLRLIHASWCPTCKAQAPILAELMADSKFKDLLYFTIDFDSQKDLVRRFGARMQSTLISFKGAAEQGRSVGDTNRQSIAALLNKVL
jgi:thiol-disulfide isomerase/thioredoxin